jgi:hypothetical protein
VRCLLCGVRWAAHAEAVGPSSKFTIPLSDLEAAVRVDNQALVEMVPVEIEPPADSRGEEPDRGWFAAGG